MSKHNYLHISSSQSSTLSRSEINQVHDELFRGVEDFLTELQARQEQQRIEEEEAAKMKKLREEQVGGQAFYQTGVHEACAWLVLRRSHLRSRMCLSVFHTYHMCQVTSLRYYATIVQWKLFTLFMHRIDNGKCTCT